MSAGKCFLIAGVLLGFVSHSHAQLSCKDELEALASLLVHPQTRGHAADLIAESNARNYVDQAARYAAERGSGIPEGMRYRIDRLVDRLRHRPRLPRPRVLDLGAGFGRTFSYFQDLGVEVHATDVSFPLLRDIRSEPPPVVSDVLALPYQPESFTGVYANAVLFHMPLVIPEEGEELAGMDQGVSEIHRILGNGDWLYATFKKGEGYRIEEDPKLGTRFFQLMTRADIEALANRRGFVIDEIDSFEYGTTEWFYVYFRKTRIPRGRN